MLSPAAQAYAKASAGIINPSRNPIKAASAGAVELGRVRVRVRKREVSVTWDGNGSGVRLPPEQCLRGSISGCSSRSLKRLSRYLRNSGEPYATFGTLTYGSVFPKSGKEVKRHLAALRERCRRAGFVGKRGSGGSLCWWLEWQERGAPHVHFVSTAWIPKGWLSKAWGAVVGDSQLERTGTRLEALRGGVDAAARYVSKYARKAAQKAVPSDFSDVGRTWAVWGRCTVPEVSAVTSATFTHALRIATLNLRLGGFMVVHTTGWVFFADSDEQVAAIWRCLQGATSFVGRHEADRECIPALMCCESLGMPSVRGPTRVVYVQDWGAGTTQHA